MDDRGPIPEGIAIGDIWRNQYCYNDSCIIIALEKTNNSWMCTCQWFDGVKNHLPISTFIDSDSYKRFSWLDSESP